MLRFYVRFEYGLLMITFIYLYSTLGGSYAIKSPKEVGSIKKLLNWTVRINGSSLSFVRHLD